MIPKIKTSLSDAHAMNKISIAIILIATFFGLATYGAITASWPFSNSDPDTIYMLLNIDIALFLALVILVSIRVFSLLKKRKQQASGAKLQLKLISFFSILAVLPAVIMATFSIVFFYFSIQSWFSDRVSTAINDSLTVAQSYLEEHQKVIKADILAMANDLNRDSLSLTGNPTLLEHVIQKQSFIRNLSEVMVFQSDGRVLAKTGFTFSLQFDSIPIQDLVNAKNGQVVLMTGEGDDRIRALVHLEGFKDTYLFVGRLVDANVLEHIETAKKAVDEYKQLETKKDDFSLSVTLIFSLVSVLILLASVLFGLIFARKIAEPISALITGTERIRAGDFDIQIHDKFIKKEDDMSLLLSAFNKMTKQIKSHQDDLLSANRELDNRRHFIEAVFSSVRTSIIALNSDKTINIANESAFKLFKITEAELKGASLKSLSKEIDLTLSRAIESKKHLYQEHITASLDGEKMSDIFIRIAFEENIPNQLCVLTLDDITELVSAQKQAAWSGVARRIAHEIKNPLTPIQLSAERLQRKYSKQIQDDLETFNYCTDTIIRQVDSIGRMVNEFSEFARMPSAVLQLNSLYGIIFDCYILHKQAYPEIEISLNTPQNKNAKTICDAGLVRQAITNLLKNAVESLKDTDKKEKKIDINLSYTEKEAIIKISDNGFGFKDDIKKSATEPYVTTKDKGTGLGLAIVKKIIEEHKGEFAFKNRIDNNCVIGATVVLTLPQT